MPPHDPTRAAALERLYVLLSARLRPGQPGFDEAVYEWWEMPRPTFDADDMDRYEFNWWMFLKRLLCPGSAEQSVRHFTLIDDPRATEFLRLAAEAATWPWPTGRLAPHYRSVIGPPDGRIANALELPKRNW